MGLCDFCNSPDPRWSYPAADVYMVPESKEYPVHHSVGGWAACDPCSELIEAGDRDGLVRRCVIGLQAHGMPSEVAMPMLREIFVAFFAARTGERVPL